MNYVSKFVSQNQKVQFEGKWMLLAEWKNVPQFGKLTSIVSFFLEFTDHCIVFHRPTLSKEYSLQMEISHMGCLFTNVV